MSHGESADVGVAGGAQEPGLAEDVLAAAPAGAGADPGFLDAEFADAEFADDDEPTGEVAGPDDVDLVDEADLDEDADLDDEAGPGNGAPWSEGSPQRGTDDEPEATVADLEQEGEIAADYVEALLDIADLDGDIDMDVEGDRALVSVVGGDLDELVGAKGEVLEALQELTRLAVQRQTGLRTRLMLDVGGYRAKRREELTEVGSDAADEVAKTGVPKRLAPMTAFERKIVHDAVAAAGLRSESEGEDPDRRVVVFPAG
jgi:spoIIIJ-associated protein